ncbi:MAG TPA: phosphatidylserine decarboxylase [Bryobacteraceae bacterium]|nr:phosphatidylserine decarboxylase [Bryobacteraceae bacterium]
MVRDGIYYFLGLTTGGVIVGIFAGPWAGFPLFLAAAFCAWFFRDPERLLPAGPVALSPADGKVVCVVPEADRQTRVSIFLNIFDVHVNRAPIGGVIADVTYQRGQFLVASKESASAQNEQNIVTIRAEDGTKVVFKQIAGLLARRIVCYKKPGDLVQSGERIGLIKFGSRVDVIFGPEWRVEVMPGMRVTGGSSVIARRAGEVALPEALSAAIVEEAALCRT